MKTHNKYYLDVTKLGQGESVLLSEASKDVLNNIYPFEISSRYLLLDVPEPTRQYEQELLQLLVSKREGFKLA